MEAKGKTRIDVVDEYAYPLPVTVISKIMVVPLADEPRIHSWINDVMEGVDLGPEAASAEQQRRREKGQKSRQELTEYLVGLVERYAKQPGDGMISKLSHEDGPDGRMSPSALVANTALLFGHAFGQCLLSVRTAAPPVFGAASAGYLRTACVTTYCRGWS